MGAALAFEVQLAGETLGVGPRHRLVAGIVEGRFQQGQRLAEQVGAGDLQRAQAKLGVEWPQRLVLAVAGGHQPGAAVGDFQRQVEVGAEQDRIAEADAQRLAGVGAESSA